jgi:hypothetical protein
MTQLTTQSRVNLRKAADWNSWAKQRNHKWCDIGECRYPPLLEDNNWIYGYWVCGRPHGKLTMLYGDYPHSFLDRVLYLFDGPERWEEEGLLHAPSGILTTDPTVAAMYGVPITRGVTVDAVYDEDFDPKNPPTANQRAPRLPQYQFPVDALPQEWTGRFDVVISDPPYSEVEDQRIYAGERNPLPHYPLRGSMEEFYRVLKRGGFVAMLHVYTGPPRSNTQWSTRGTIAVAPSTQLNWTRTLSILQKK